MTWRRIFKNPGVTLEMIDRYAVRYRGSYADVPYMNPPLTTAEFEKLVTWESNRPR